LLEIRSKDMLGHEGLSPPPRLDDALVEGVIGFEP